MTREEAIEYLTPIATSAVLPRYKEALGMSIAALKEVDFDQVENEPLTLEKLRKIAEDEEYGSHIWVKDLADHDLIAAVTDIVPGYGVVAVWSYVGPNTGLNEFSERNYGKTWLAYRRKPITPENEEDV